MLINICFSKEEYLKIFFFIARYSFIDVNRQILLYTFAVNLIVAIPFSVSAGWYETPPYINKN